MRSLIAANGTALAARSIASLTAPVEDAVEETEVEKLRARVMHLICGCTVLCDNLELLDELIEAVRQEESDLRWMDMEP